MHFLITGTAGFIGFHLARRLLDEGHSVTGFDGMTRYYEVSLKERRHAILSTYSKFKPIIAMLESRKPLTEAFSSAPPDVVVHLAAQAGVRYSLENPDAYIGSNLVGSWNILDLCRQFRPNHLLLASTSSIYGANHTIPFKEADKADEPLTLYAATKKAMEVMAHSQSHLHKTPTTAFRFFTVYGPWGRPDMALFKFVSAILDGRPIDVYGHGQMSRDFTYIDDLVEAIVRLIPVIPQSATRTDAAIDTISMHAPFRIVNIGGGQPVALGAFIETVEEALGQKAFRNMLPMQQGDVPHTFAAPELLHSLTGYTPQTPVSEGVRRFVEWYRQAYRMNIKAAEIVE
ncbi:UDP-glucuronate 5'-epimerase 2 (plasmid) [Rhizobium etli bv. mimosae str. IE4771]|uniref:UDP-glucuronate 5'-epimerase 2 n=1 Tax=Rhizobium etli bv. mimosae str. IE4771 TaxID=1432050 RepID=A0A060I8W6_RHIET|nr:NAD-dependent epimerase/dehydratase family protein [Rhizobium sp. IE4771]AIC31413.1 UDP-glucuronate 5'-epimerase 2 [Rhizobium sp. IE4771]